MDFYVYNLITFALILVFIISFVTIILWFKKKENKERAELISKAISNGVQLDPQLFTPKKSIPGAVWMAILRGAGFGVLSFGIFALIIQIIHQSNESVNMSEFIPVALLVSIGIGLMITYSYCKKHLKQNKQDQQA